MFVRFLDSSVLPSVVVREIMEEAVRTRNVAHRCIVHAFMFLSASRHLFKFIPLDAGCFAHADQMKEMATKYFTAVLDPKASLKVSNLPGHCL